MEQYSVFCMTVDSSDPSYKTIFKVCEERFLKSIRIPSDNTRKLRREMMSRADWTRARDLELKSDPRVYPNSSAEKLCLKHQAISLMPSQWPLCHSLFLFSQIDSSKPVTILAEGLKKRLMRRNTAIFPIRPLYQLLLHEIPLALIRNPRVLR